MFPHYDCRHSFNGPGTGNMTELPTFCLIIVRNHCVFMTESPLNTFFKSLIKNLLFAAKCIEPLLRFALQALKGDLLGTRAIVKRQGKHAFVQAFYNPLNVISD